MPEDPAQGLPAMPEVTAFHCGDWKLPERTVALYVDAKFTAEQMRSYALAAVEAERERIFAKFDNALYACGTVSSADRKLIAELARAAIQKESP